MTISCSHPSHPLPDSIEELKRLICGLREEAARRTGTEETLRQSLAEASEAARARGELLAHASHEMRTQLQVLSGALELIGETPLSPRQRECVTRCRQANTLLLSFVNDILDSARMDAGRLPIELSPFSPAELIRSTGEMLGGLARSKGLSLELRAAPDLPGVVLGDARRLQQVLVNLAGNAIKFTRKGTITISVARDDASPGPETTLRFSVADTGIGIPGAKIDEIFEPFAQLDGPSAESAGGTGLGLAIARKLVELMNGSVEVESEEGKGTRFTFSIPFGTPSPPAEWEPAPSPAPSVSPGRRLRILLAEDTADIRQLITVFLTSSGHLVEAVADGKQAVEKFTSGSFDIVLMDMQMPVLDGYAATRQIREWERAHGAGPVPILALTAHAERKGHRRSREAGCTAHLAKPINKETLLGAVAAHAGA